MLNQKPFQIDRRTHVSVAQTYVERHEFKDHSRAARFRRHPAPEFEDQGKTAS
jgi:hypothetical protein